MKIQRETSKNTVLTKVKSKGDNNCGDGKNLFNCPAEQAVKEINFVLEVRRMEKL